MDKLINIRVHRLADGYYRAVSNEFNDIVVEGRTAWEALTAARAIAKRQTGTTNHTVTDTQHVLKSQSS